MGPRTLCGRRWSTADSDHSYARSGYDFGYLLKLVSCASLPPNEVEFFELLKIWFPCIYDISACGLLGSRDLSIRV